MGERRPTLSRRGFVKLLGLSGLGLTGVAACSPVVAQGAASPAAVPTPTPTAGQRRLEMDRAYQGRMEAFRAPTEGLGGEPLDPKMDGEVKVFELTCKPVMWETEPGTRIEAWTYNGAVPGPEIRVTEGDLVRVVLTNELEESTSVHWRGLLLPNDLDGVSYMNRPPIAPGESYTYDFMAKPVGSHAYHSHHNAAKQTPMGLFGAFIIEPVDPIMKPQVAHEYTVILNDGPLGYTLNGKSFPATRPLTCKWSESILIRFMNQGLLAHAMHLHGMPVRVVSKDGYETPIPYYCDTLNIAPGERWDVVVEAYEPGVWALHCSTLTHAESADGVSGMATVLVVED